jgi:23S rRNA (cytosine1962-C5)-methyltransferase
MIGKFKVIRPSLNSPYNKKNPDMWENADAIYTKNDRGSGHWNFYTKIPESMIIDLPHDIKAKIKFTPFGHIGIFPEQQSNWDLLLKIKRKDNSPMEVLNLFAYSGISTLYCLKSEMNVCHVDASKGMVDWARENAEISDLAKKNVRWIVDDVNKFIKREIKRGKKYSGFILDPPSFGRGSKGEIWKIEDDLFELFSFLMELCNSKPDFVILSCHTSGFSPLVLERLINSFIKTNTGNSLNTELFIPEESGEKLSGGFCGYYFSDKITR